MGVLPVGVAPPDTQAARAPQPAAGVAPPAATAIVPVPAPSWVFERAFAKRLGASGALRLQRSGATPSIGAGSHARLYRGFSANCDGHSAVLRYNGRTPAWRPAHQSGAHGAIMGYPSSSSGGACD